MRNQKVTEVMTALETAIAQTEAAQSKETQSHPWAARSLEEIEPTRWTRKIEDAIGSLDEMEALRVTFDEKALIYVSARLAYGHGSHLVSETIQPLCEAIRAVIELLDEKNAVSASDRALLQALVLKASDVHRKERPPRGPISMDDFDDRSRPYAILVSTFKAFAGNVKRYAAGAGYTRDLVVHGKTYLKHLSESVDLRHMVVVPFRDCVNSTHPANVRLEAAYNEAYTARAKARGQVKVLRGDGNGEVNERQHAVRMIGLMHGDVMCSGNIVQQVESQNGRRVAYESLRQKALGAIAEMEERYADLKAALVDATAETDAFYESDINGQQVVTIDRKDTIRLAMNNCLAVDYFLREYGREIEELKTREARDLSLGNGRLALDAAYSDVASRYRPFKISHSEDAKE